MTYFNVKENYAGSCPQPSKVIFKAKESIDLDGDSFYSTYTRSVWKRETIKRQRETGTAVNLGNPGSGGHYPAESAKGDEFLRYGPDAGTPRAAGSIRGR